MVRRKKEKALSYLLPGVSLFFLGLGSLFSVDLVRYNFWLMLAMILVVIFYINGTLLKGFNKKSLNKNDVILGFVALVLVTLFFGIQSPQLPFDGYVIALGIVLFLVGISKMKS